MTGKFRFFEDSNTAHGLLEMIMWTNFDVLIVGANRTTAELVWHDIYHELIRLEKLLNRFDRQSEIYKINQTAFLGKVKVSREIWDILQECKEFHRKTIGLFDITLHDFRKIQFLEKSRSICFLSDELYIDLGGFAKGFALKKIEEILKNAGIKTAFVNFGNSSIMGVGHHPYGDSWKVGINNPFNTENIVDEINLNDMSVSISGNTPAYSKHIKNPKSGKYSDVFQLIYVTAKDPLVAEVLSTALMIADEQEKAQILENFEINDTKTYIF